MDRRRGKIQTERSHSTDGTLSSRKPDGVVRSLKPDRPQVYAALAQFREKLPFKSAGLHSLVREFSGGGCSQFLRQTSNPQITDVRAFHLIGDRASGSAHFPIS